MAFPPTMQDSSTLCLPGAPGRPSREQGPERHRRILEAARSLFLSRGFGETSLESIAKAAGTARRPSIVSASLDGVSARDLAELLVAGAHTSLRRKALAGAPPDAAERARRGACALEIVMRALAPKVVL